MGSGDRKLRILYAGMRWDYGFPDRGDSFEHQTFFSSLAAWERTAALRTFDFVSLAKRYGIERMSNLLLEEVHRFAPDVLFAVWFNEGSDPDRRVIQEIGTSTPCRTIGWFCDSHWRYETFDRPWAEVLDFAVTTSEVAHEKAMRDGLGSKFIKSQWGAAPGYRRLPVARKDIDVSFVGLPHGNRREVVETLRRAGLRVATWGTGWGERLTFEEMVGVFNRSKVNLSFSESNDGSVSQIKARVFEVPACGGFLLAGAAENTGDYYRPGKEIEVFESTGELIEKTRSYLADGRARERIARAGHRRTLAEHTYARRFEEIFGRAGLLGETASAEAPSVPLAGPPPAAGRAARRRPEAEGVSIVVCTHNDSRYLPAALESCRTQSGETEILLVDDGSSEPLDPAAREYVREGVATLIRRRKNGGLSAARNTGIARARHGLVLVLDADDFLFPGALAGLVAGLGEHDVAYGNMTDSGRLCRPVVEQLTRERFLATNPLFASSLFRKSVWSAVGGYLVRPGPHYEDWNFWARAFARGFRFRYVPVVVYNHTTRPGSMLRELDARTAEFAKLALEGVFES